MRRRLTVLAAAAGALLALPGVAAAADCPVPAGAEVDFGYTGDVQQVKVPDGVVRVEVYARGGHGGKEPDTAQGGQGGTTQATLVVRPGQCLDVYVGGYGGGHGGWGWGRGGVHGTTPFVGKDGAGGGGGTAIVLDGTPLVVAGGGGGGGGGSEFPHAYPGGAGGDGANGGGPGTPDGSDGDNPALYAHPYIGGDGGVMSGRDGADGHGTSVWGWLTGAGGAGGGGYRGGDGGIGPPVERADRLHVIRGGGGGGGGSSHVQRDATDATFGVEDVDCPDGRQPDCVGEVTLDWVEVPARVAPYGGSGESTVIGTPYAKPLQALVTSASGVPVPGVEVTFTAPLGGATGRFDAGAPAQAVTAVTNRKGLATTPALTAGTTGGDWTASAAAAGVRRTTSFALRNLAAATMLALSSPDNPSVVGEPVRFAAAVGAAPSAAGTPSGVVEFLIDGERLGDPVAVDEAGIALSPPVLNLTRGTHEITAVFDGGRSYLPSDGALTQATEQAQSLVTITSSANPAPDSTPVTFTATVRAAPPGGGTPTGTVQFRVDGADAGAPVALAGGVARSAPVAGLATGPHVVEAIYDGDASHAAGSGTFEQATGDGVAAVEVAVPRRATPWGEPYPATATVTSGATGSVTFSLDGETVCEDLTLDGSAQATCELPGTAQPGLHEIVAAYSGDGSLDPARGRAAHRVDRARTDVAVEAVPGPSIFGAAVVLHADVDVRAPGAGTPGGDVQFLVDGLPAGQPVALGPDGATSAPLAGLTAGPHLVEAVYPGDPRFGGGQRQAVAIVDPAETSATLASSAPLAAPGQRVTWTMQLGAISPGAGSPEGTVQFRVDGKPHGPAVRVRESSVTSEPATLPVGDHDVRASFSGDADWLPVEATLEQVVATSAAPPDDRRPTPPGDGRGGTPQPPAPPVAAPARAPLCHAPFVVTRLGLQGRRIHLAGQAQPELAGRRVALRHDGRRLLRATVGRDGAFRAQVRRPAGRGWAREEVRVSIAGVHSRRMLLGQPVRIGRPVPRGGAKVRVALRGPRNGRMVLERRTHCGAAMGSLRRVRLDRRGRAAVTLPRPAAGADAAVYQLRTSGRGARASLPVVVRPAAR